jgi:glycosyltransferase involved in cell wall biosynthesis
LSRVGRLGMADDSPDYVSCGVEVKQVPVRALQSSRTFAASLRNLVNVYTVAIMRLRKDVLKTSARTIFVGHVSLFWLGSAHQRRWGSQIVINGRERPGGVRTKGSLASWFSRVEPIILRRIARRQPMVIAVCESHAEDFRALGFENVQVVRNVPVEKFAPTFVAPPECDELRVCCVGSLYPGRGIEALIDGVIMARSRGAMARLDITGPASDSYSAELASRIQAASAGDYITIHGPCPADEVAGRYQAAHVGTALYEAADSANDSLSNKIFESIVAGRPVIAGNLPENSKIVETHSVGWAVPVTGIAIGELLVSLAADRESVREMARHCHSVGQRNFTWEAEIQSLRDAVESKTRHP